MFRTCLLAITTLAATTPARAAGPLAVTTTTMVEAKTRAADGGTNVTLVPARRVVPGDRLVFIVSYRNTGATTLSDIVIANPLPSAVAYRATAQGSPAPEVSTDGKTFAPLAILRVAGRAATADDVTHLRWRTARPLAAGAQGQFAFQAVLK